MKDSNVQSVFLIQVYPELQLHTCRTTIISKDLCHIFNVFPLLSGYSIFVIVGDFPNCEAQQLLQMCPVEPQKAPQSTSQLSAAPGRVINKADLKSALTQVNSGSTGEGMHLYHR